MNLSTISIRGRMEVKILLCAAGGVMLLRAEFCARLTRNSPSRNNDDSADLIALVQ
jgi:hypothetical protein